MKIKVFRFEVSNSTSSPLKDDINSSWYREGQAKISSESKIEETINRFIKDKAIVNISINTIDVHYHNNARGNTIHLIYTIVYEEEK